VGKPFSAREGAARSRAVLRRADDEGPAPNDGALEMGPVRIDSDHRSVSLDDDLKLTCKEFELLEVLLREAGNLVSCERLIDEVQDVNWGRLDEDPRRAVSSSVRLGPRRSSVEMPSPVQARAIRPPRSAASSWCGSREVPSPRPSA
jgi:DNA-binding response OmpR family regulator